jgi:NADH:ubiquinone oxidoreductase subunit 5 (subunit L)/multisubunit Na+/H+ antiporter MnhA subunit
MRADARGKSFAVRMCLLIASVLGFVAARDLVVLALCWIASGALLGLLIRHAQGWAEANRAAGRAWTAFAIGDAALVAAFALLAWGTGTTRIEPVLAGVAELPAWMSLAAALLLIVAAAARCGLPPFSRWLLRSMTAPTPVSAVMHAGLVNAGGFLLIRFAPVMEAAPAARWTAIGLGFLAALWGVGVMLVRPDVKRGLAGSTVAQMGFMVLTCGFGAYAAAAWHLVAHGLFKAWLFLSAGSAIGETSAPALRPAASDAPLAAALLALGGGGVAIAAGQASSELLALTLTAAGGLALAGAVLMTSYRLALLPVLIGVITANLAGVALFAWTLDHRAPPLAGAGIAALVLAAALLAAWVRQARGQALPPALYARLAAA